MDKLVTIVPKKEMNNSKNYFIHGLFSFLYAFVKYLSFPLCNYFRFIIIKMFSKNIKATYISDGVQLYFPWKISIGKESSLNTGVIIDGFGGVQIGNGVRIAAYVTINTADHNFSDTNIMIKDQGYICSSVNIEDDVWIGAHSCINKGVTIGKGSIIGSGSVVVKSIPAYSIAVGNPCKVIKKRY